MLISLMRVPLRHYRAGCPCLYQGTGDVDYSMEDCRTDDRHGILLELGQK